MAAAFFNGSLVIDWSESIGHECKISISDWDSGLIVTSHDQDKLSPLSLLDVGDWIFGVDEPAINRWRATLPNDVNKALEHLPSHQASILRWAVDSSIITDLLVSNPLLLWLLVDDGLFARSSLGEVNRRLSVRQRYLCAELGLAGTEQQTRILKSVALASLGANSIRSLKDLLDNEVVCSFLRHRGEISEPVIKVVKRYPWLVRYPVKALIDDLQEGETLRYFQDVIRMLDDLGPLYRCRTVNSLLRLHDRLVAHINDRGFNFIRDEYGDIKQLPAPPLPGNESIKPLTSQQEIVDEGREMKHCIASYMGSVSLGEFCVNQMYEPERLTIGIVVGISASRDRDKQCFLREVRGKCNRYPSDESIKLIEDRFEEATLHYRA